MRYSTWEIIRSCCISTGIRDIILVRLSLGYMKFAELPSPVTDVCQAFVTELAEILGSNLHGIYMYGAAVFPDSGTIQDIDCHVILKDFLCDQTKEAILQLQRDLSDRFPSPREELDAYFILYKDAEKTCPPMHQLRSEIRDESWALHCAHVRAGRYISLYGPDPRKIFPAPTWDEISAALEHELRFIKKNLKYPDYCVLNLCRIMYSVQERDVAVSKFFSGEWARDQFPEWTPLIEAAVASYQARGTSDEAELLKREVESFVKFGSALIRDQSQVV